MHFARESVGSFKLMPEADVLITGAGGMVGRFLVQPAVQRNYLGDSHGLGPAPQNASSTYFYQGVRFKCGLLQMFMGPKMSALDIVVK